MRKHRRKDEERCHFTSLHFTDKLRSATMKGTSLYHFMLQGQCIAVSLFELLYWMLEKLQKQKKTQKSSALLT